MTSLQSDFTSSFWPEFETAASATRCTSPQARRKGPMATPLSSAGLHEAAKSLTRSKAERRDLNAAQQKPHMHRALAAAYQRALQLRTCQSHHHDNPLCQDGFAALQQLKCCVQP
eukprot:CAMPEP_0172839858 /NCGR_PEP_ID=MMETSP1075-20121228/28872_1 /TAXON_ID=2916 /ORGANISM="Ceratium fusus, Strain PA161109" /LENGTH=114 /DNA_ID=CAMNT_0013683577 /DNA_START=58 /DNA_END=400 /DNA_ORIENTATION=+